MRDGQTMGGTNDHTNVKREDDVEWSEQAYGEKFGYRRRSLSSATGGEKLGCSLYEVSPGRQAWPYHYHGANEEAIYVLHGSGLLRVNGEEVEVGEGSYATFPKGLEGTHELINTSDETLRYLCFSTMEEPDVMVYPNSNKLGVFVGAAPGGPKEKRILSKFLRGDAEVGYFEGEE